MSSDDALQARRQPVVTATGIILGFTLNFASSWVRSDTAVGERLAFVVAALVLVGVICLIVVLARILATGVRADEVEAYYRQTIRIFVVGVSLAVAGVVIDMASNFWET